ncbi:histidine phosphatase family protein [Nocardioides aquaticus]|uniref:histidine phosphatase family protein n=1 Tax=Nocardioides TaxID=1839 RepID=UPI001BD4047A
MRRLTQGQTSHPLLTHVGREQARAAADIIASDLADRQERLERLVTSDLVRAVETAAIISDALGVPPMGDRGRMSPAWWQSPRGEGLRRSCRPHGSPMASG